MLARPVIWGTVLVTAILVGGGAEPSGAHTRERLRIDALELEKAKTDAVVAARLKTLEAENGRLQAALEERREHGRRLEARLAAVEGGLGRTLGELRREFQEADGTISGEIAAERTARVAAEKLGAERAEALAAQVAALRRSAEVQGEALQGFRKSLADYARQVDGSYEGMRKGLTALDARLVEKEKELRRRLDDLVEVMGEENRKLRAAIEGLNQGPPEPGIHVVRPGENLYGIARAYGLTSEQLRKANPDLETKNGVIHPGDRLRIPAEAP